MQTYPLTSTGAQELLSALEGLQVELQIYGEIRTGILTQNKDWPLAWFIEEESEHLSTRRTHFENTDITACTTKDGLPLLVAEDQAPCLVF